MRVLEQPLGVDGESVGRVFEGGQFESDGWRNQVHGLRPEFDRGTQDGNLGQAVEEVRQRFLVQL